MSREPRPIIIKRPVVAGGHGHHGGAWKVAYADFVTAMMAFFLLLWLISSARVYGQSWMLIRAKARLTKPA